MIRSNTLVILLFVATILFTAAFACNFSTDSTNSSTTTPTAGNATTPPPAKSTPETAKKDISGSYDATGTNPGGGGMYKAELKVTPHDDVYQFTWESGGKSYDGVGVQTGNSIAVAFTEGDNGKGCGVVLYSIGSDGSLDGKTGYWGVNTMEREKATRTSGDDLAGKYDISGTNPGGEAYKGSLDVSKDGEGYIFKWNAGSVFQGFGIKTGDKAAVGFGGKQCSFVAYEVKSDGTLEGKWGGPGSNSFGSETAKKK